MDYLVASTPRSGSNLLCSLLQATGACGEPRELLCPTQVAEHGPALCGFDSLAGLPHRFDLYLDACRRAFTRGGRFGIKAHFEQLERAVEQGLDLARHFPARVVHLTRADLVGQALSLVRAVQTRAWIAGQAERGEPRFDPELVHAAVRKLAREQAAWESLWREGDVEPYRLSYEALCADFEGELRGVVRFLDHDPDALDLRAAVQHVLAHYAPQRDALSESWRARYAEWVRARAAERSAALARDAAPERARAAGAL